MFTSPTFRWTFVLWRFFSVMASTSVLLTLITFVLGLICRVNFGKGLPRYLNAEELLPGEDMDATKERNPFVSSSEKIAFPSARGPIPTFSVAFGKGSDVPPPSRMQFGSSRSAVALPDETHARESRTTSLPRILFLNGSGGAATITTTQLSRQLSNGSQTSTISTASSGSGKSSRRSKRGRGDNHSDCTRSWVIE